MIKRPTKAHRKPRSSLKSLATVKKEIEQLRDWSKRHAEVEFIVPLEGSSIKYLGRIVDTTLDDGRIATFHFVSKLGMQAILMPQSFPKSSVENIEGMHNGVYVEGKAKGSTGFSVVEALFQKKANANLAGVLEKLRTWERLQLDLHVLLNQGGHAFSFLGNARELSAGMFSFVSPPAPAQLIIRVEEYKYMELKSEGDTSSITLIDPRTEELCVVSDAATQPETLFKRVIEISSTVH